MITEAVLGWKNSEYTVSESQGWVELCAVIEGEIAPDLSLSVFLRTEDGSANSGKTVQQ